MIIGLSYFFVVILCSGARMITNRNKGQLPEFRGQGPGLLKVCAIF